LSAQNRVRIEIDDGIADVRMTRGEKHNALDSAMFAALGDAVDELREAADVRVVVLSGEGKSFCSGLDFASFLGEGINPNALFERRDGEFANTAQRVAFGWRELPVPVIAALHGACYGGGCQIALGADIRIAAPNTRMSVMEIKYGLIPDMSITQTLPRLARIDIAKELTFTGRVVEAAEAVELGLATRVGEDSLAAARELATEIASKSPDAIRAGKRLLNDTWLSTPAEGLALEAEEQAKLLGSPNQIAAVQAAFSGEPAQFEPVG
jgi:enoyl-CoA hydratase/carnithine racemase